MLQEIAAQTFVRFSRRPWLLGVVGLGLLVGCQIPEAPEWDIDLAVELPAASLGVELVLPEGVSVARSDDGGGRVFRVRRLGAATRRQIGDLCGADCPEFDVPATLVPGFTAVDTLTVFFDQRLASVELEGAVMRIGIENDLGFDPLRPNNDPQLAGSITLVTRSLVTGALVDSMRISGASERLASETTLRIERRLPPVIVTEGVSVVATMRSPVDGQRATLTPELGFGFHVELDELEVRAIVAVVDSLELATSARADQAGEFRKRLLDELVDGVTRVESTTLDFTVTHSMRMAGTLEVSIAGREENLFGGEGRELNFRDVDFSYAPDGKEQSRVITAEQIAWLAELDAVRIGFRGVAHGWTLEDDDARPLVRVTPDQAAAIQLTVGARLRVGG